MQQPPIFEGETIACAFPLHSGIIPAKPYPNVSYALLYQAIGWKMDKVELGPHLCVAKHHLGWTIHTCRNNANFTLAIGAITDAINLLIIHVEI